MLIGAGTTVLGNITIGRGAQVAANSLVLKPVPPKTMVAGSPAREVGKVTGERCKRECLPPICLSLVELMCPHTIEAVRLG